MLIAALNFWSLAVGSRTIIDNGAELGDVDKQRQAEGQRASRQNEGYQDWINDYEEAEGQVVVTLSEGVDGMSGTLWHWREQARISRFPLLIMFPKDRSCVAHALQTAGEQNAKANDCRRLEEKTIRIRLTSRP